MNNKYCALILASLLIINSADMSFCLSTPGVADTGLFDDSLSKNLPALSPQNIDTRILKLIRFFGAGRSPECEISKSGPDHKPQYSARVTFCIGTHPFTFSTRETFPKAKLARQGVWEIASKDFQLKKLSRDLEQLKIDYITKLRDHCRWNNFQSPVFKKITIGGTSENPQVQYTVTVYDRENNIAAIGTSDSFNSKLFCKRDASRKAFEALFNNFRTPNNAVSERERNMISGPGMIPIGDNSGIGASCLLFSYNNQQVIFDCGIRLKKGHELPDLELLSRVRPSALFLTHAHLDHIGAIPLLHKNFPDIPIYATPTTIKLAKVILDDTVKISRNQTIDGFREFPLYDQEMVDDVLSAITPVSPNTWYKTSRDIKILPINAGHIAGAVSYLIHTPDRRILITGDYSIQSQGLIRGLDRNDIPFDTVDEVFAEATYGNYIHLDRQQQEEELANSVASVINRGGIALIPAYALGRTQEILSLLRYYQLTQPDYPQFPIFTGGMALPICRIYDEERAQLSIRDDIFQTVKDESLFFGPSSSIDILRMHNFSQALSKPSCIVIPSGMLIGGFSIRVAQQILSDPKNACLFSGFLDEESPGKILSSLKKGEQITLNGKTIRVRAQIKRYRFSAHVDQQDNVNFIASLHPWRVVFNHGVGWENFKSLIDALSPMIDGNVCVMPQTGIRMKMRKNHLKEEFDSISAKNLSPQGKISSRVEDCMPGSIIILNNSGRPMAGIIKETKSGGFEIISFGRQKSHVIYPEDIIQHLCIDFNILRQIKFNSVQSINGLVHNALNNITRDIPASGDIAKVIQQKGLASIPLMRLVDSLWGFRFTPGDIFALWKRIKKDKKYFKTTGNMISLVTRKKEVPGRYSHSSY